VAALIESGEIRLIEDEELRRKALEYHSSVEAAPRIIDAVDRLRDELDRGTR
jgi:hypothetical protein